MTVVRIPVVGPGQFNMLVVVSEDDKNDFKMPLSDGRLNSRNFIVGTKFILKGHDTRVEPIHLHSTVVSLRGLRQSHNTNFTYAGDAVTGRFDQTGDVFGIEGRWLLDITATTLIDHEKAEMVVSYCSWILCHEPTS
jgi:hypothetical protein